MNNKNNPTVKTFDSMEAFECLVNDLTKVLNGAPYATAISALDSCKSELQMNAIVVFEPPKS